MKDIDLDMLTGENLVDHAVIAQKFKEYLMEVLEYDDDEADFVLEGDFKNPYDTPFIMQEYEGDVTVDGKDYEVRSCYTDFRACGIFHLDDAPAFKFCMLFDKGTMKDQTVGSYQNAQKKYICLEVDEEKEAGRSFLDREKCTSCGALVDNRTAVDDGVFVCDECLDKDYVYCDECEEYYADWVMKFAYLEDGRTLCEYCAEENGILLEE